MNVCMKFILWVFLPLQIFAQNKIDSTLTSADTNHTLIKKKIPESKIYSGETKLPIQNFSLQGRSHRFGEKFLQDQENMIRNLVRRYQFSAEELNSGLSEDELNAIMKNKQQILDILEEKNPESPDMFWENIRKFLGFGKKVAAIILAIISIIKFH